jgi:hypothetical protein
LPQTYNRSVETRLRQVAGSIGLRTASAKCDPNLVVIVAGRSGAFIEQLRKERPDIFEGVDYAQVAAALRTKEPVRTWQSIEPRGADGRPLERVSSIEFGDGPKPVSNAYILRGTTALASRLVSAVRQDLVRSFVVLDVDAIDGLTLTQIADYAAMRLLARTKAPPHPSASTILGLFSDPAVPSGVAHLTRWDFAYLWSLYNTDGSAPAGAQKCSIAGAIREDARQRSER